MATMATPPKKKKHVFDGQLARPAPKKAKNVSQEPAAEDETWKMSDEIPPKTEAFRALLGHEYLLHWSLEGGNIHLKILRQYYAWRKRERPTCLVGPECSWISLYTRNHCNCGKFLLSCEDAIFSHIGFF